jgi:hypothetical protein
VEAGLAGETSSGPVRKRQPRERFVWCSRAKSAADGSLGQQRRFIRLEARPNVDVNILGRPGCRSSTRAIGSGELLDSSFLAGDMLMVGLL